MQLQQASLNKDAAKLKQLIKDGAQIDERNERGETALLSAAQIGYLKAVEVLINSGANVDSRDQNGRSPLFYAYQKGHAAVIEVLLKAGANNRVSDTKSGESPIYTACRWGHSFPVLLALIAEGVDLDVQHKDKWTPLHVACRKGHLAVVKEFVQSGADIDIKDKLGGSALVLACLSGQVAVVKALLSANVDVNLQRHSGDSSLHTASHNGHDVVVELLVKANAVVDIRGENGRSPLHIACARGHVAVMQTLINANANVNLQDDNGWTPVFTATLCSRESAVKFLLANGAIAHLTPRSPPFTCLQVACFIGCSNTVKDILLQLNERSIDVAQSLSTSCAAVAAQCTASLNSVQRMTSLVPQTEGQTSSQLHDQLNKAGFTSAMATLQSAVADVMQHIERKRRGWDKIYLVGSFSEGWGNSLSSSGGKTDHDSDIDVTEFVAGRLYHLRGRCNCGTLNREAIVDYENGHVFAKISANTPARHDFGSSLRPAFDKVDAYQCCCYPHIHVLHTPRTHLPQSLLDSLRKEVLQSNCHLVAAAPPGLTGNRLRVSTTFLEKLFMRSLSDVQGQFFIFLKYLVKKVIQKKAKGLKTFHAKCLLFRMVDETPAEEWQPCNLVALTKRALHQLLSNLLNSEFETEECMRHFFLRDAAVYLRNGHSGKGNIAHVVSDIVENLPQHVANFKNKLKPVRFKGGIFYFHPFLNIPYMFFNYLSSSPILQYHEIYGSVRDLVLQMAGRSCTLQSLKGIIDRIPNCAKTARETLRAMAFLKFGKQEKAIEALRDARDHSVSRGIPCDMVHANSADLFGMIWRHLKASDSAWKFEIDSLECATFDFLPEFIRDTFPLRIDQYEQFFFVNFDALKKCLLLEFTKDCEGEVSNCWFVKVAQSEDADAQELLMTLHYCRDEDLLVNIIHKHRSVIVNDLLARKELLQLMRSWPDLRETSCLVTLNKLRDDSSYVQKMK